jgi:MOSC domain-containing protein YiiM
VTGNIYFYTDTEQSTMKGIIVAVCRSEKTGTKKEPCGAGMFIENFGMAGDAHAAHTVQGVKRHVSLLSTTSIAKMQGLGIEMGPGDFAENLTVDGIDLPSLIPGTQLRAADTVLEITQIGKACHKGCAIFKAVGTCVMPKEGVFAKVVRGGEIKTGDTIEVIGKDKELTNP